MPGADISFVTQLESGGISTWEKVFDSKGNSNALISVYDELNKKFFAAKD